MVSSVGVLTITAAADLALRWHTVTGVAEELGGSPIAQAESVVHEFAHAVVIGIEPSMNISDRVSRRFRKYKRDRAADVSECAALAVERVVFETLDWSIDHDKLVQLACEEMRRMNPKVAALEVERQLGLPLSALRAGQVIAWLCRFTGTEPPPDAT